MLPLSGQPKPPLVSLSRVDSRAVIAPEVYGFVPVTAIEAPELPSYRQLIIPLPKTSRLNCILSTKYRMLLTASGSVPAIDWYVSLHGRFRICPGSVADPTQPASFISISVIEPNCVPVTLLSRALLTVPLSVTSHCRVNEPSPKVSAFGRCFYRALRFDSE
jgi:hypothetical protein